MDWSPISRSTPVWSTHAFRTGTLARDERQWCFCLKLVFDLSKWSQPVLVCELILFRTLDWLSLLSIFYVSENLTWGNSISDSVMSGCSPAVFFNFQSTRHFEILRSQPPWAHGPGGSKPLSRAASCEALWAGPWGLWDHDQRGLPCRREVLRGAGARMCPAPPAFEGASQPLPWKWTVLKHFLKGKEAKMKEVRYGKIAHYVRKSVWNSWVKTWLKGENCSFFSANFWPKAAGALPSHWKGCPKLCPHFYFFHSSGCWPIIFLRW